MRIEYWGRIRFKGNSFYVTIPAAEAYKIQKAVFAKEPECTEDAIGGLVGREVRVEVTL